MKKKERARLKKASLRFVSLFSSRIRQQLDVYEKLQSEIKFSAPKVLLDDSMRARVFLSKKHGHVLICFEGKRKTNYTEFEVLKNNAFGGPLGIDDYSVGSAILATGSSGGIEGVSFEGFYPVEAVGSNVNLQLKELAYTVDSRRYEIEFAFIFTSDVLLSVEPESFADSIIYEWWDYYRASQEEKDVTEDRLDAILRELKGLIGNPDTLESQIDDFFFTNQIILETCLNMIPGSLSSQPMLKNWIKTNFEQDMIPDAIFQNIHQDWVILDYKRSKRVLKKEDTARADVISEVHELKTQLKNYREYFDEKQHRESFRNEFGFYVEKKPSCYGIIGLVPPESRSLFKQSIEDEPGWITIESYDAICRSFENYVSNRTRSI